mmetsp:Transcript_53907/g.174138  ORF Transcript_53907/g.174138 Transcript_53907/m.174138 type:complete len:963 (-) Transcript_53907:68-2956(-)
MAADAACFGMATPGVVLKVEVSGCFYRLPVSAPASLEDAEKALHSLHLTRHGVLCEADAGWRNLTPESWAGAVAVVSARLPAASATDISEARRPVVVRLRAAPHAVAAAAEETARAAEAAVVGLEAPQTTRPECPSASPASHAAAPPLTAAQQLPEPSAPPPTPEEPAAPEGEPEQFDMAAEDSSDEAIEEGDHDSNGRGPQLISVGAMLEAVSPVVVREHEILCEGSPILRRLPAGAHVQVLRMGSDPGGRRVFVRDEYGIDGWASVVSMEGGRLLRPARSRGQSDRPEGAGQPQGAPVRDLHALLRERHDLNRAEVAAAAAAGVALDDFLPPTPTPGEAPEGPGCGGGGGGAGGRDLAVAMELPGSPAGSRPATPTGRFPSELGTTSQGFGETLVTFADGKLSVSGLSRRMEEVGSRLKNLEDRTLWWEKDGRRSSREVWATEEEEREAELAHLQTYADGAAAGAAEGPAAGQREAGLGLEAAKEQRRLLLESRQRLASREVQVVPREQHMPPGFRSRVVKVASHHEDGQGSLRRSAMPASQRAATGQDEVSESDGADDEDLEGSGLVDDEEAARRRPQQHGDDGASAKAAGSAAKSAAAAEEQRHGAEEQRQQAEEQRKKAEEHRIQAGEQRQLAESAAQAAAASAAAARDLKRELEEIVRAIEFQPPVAPAPEPPIPTASAGADVEAAEVAAQREQEMAEHIERQQAEYMEKQHAVESRLHQLEGFLEESTQQHELPPQVAEGMKKMCEDVGFCLQRCQLIGQLPEIQLYIKRFQRSLAMNAILHSHWVPPPEKLSDGKLSSALGAGARSLSKTAASPEGSLERRGQPPPASPPEGGRRLAASQSAPDMQLQGAGKDKASPAVGAKKGKAQGASKSQKKPYRTVVDWVRPHTPLAVEPVFNPHGGTDGGSGDRILTIHGEPPPEKESPAPPHLKPSPKAADRPAGVPFLPQIATIRRM